MVGRSSRLTGTIAWMRLGRLTPAGVGVNFGGDAVVVASDALHGDEQQRHGDGDDPGSVGEFRDQNDDQNDGGEGGPDGVDRL